MKKIGLIIGAILMVLAGMKVSKYKRRAVKASNAHQQLLADGSAQSLELAKKFDQQAKANNAKARQAAEVTRKRLDQIGKSDADIATTVSGWNKRRLQ